MDPTSLYCQSLDKNKIDSFFYSKIPFDSLLAKNDMKNNCIRILSLLETALCIDPALSGDELKIIETRFGFKFYSQSFQIPQKYLTVKEHEYNKIMYKHLDSINGLNTESEIQNEYVRLVFEKMVLSKQPDNYIFKNIRKNFRNESSQIKDKIFSADKSYSERDFKNAYEQYLVLEKEAISVKTKAYIYNSKYHCLLNMYSYDKAKELKENDTYKWIRITKIR